MSEGTGSNADQELLTAELISLVAETNGLALLPTLDLFTQSRRLRRKPELQASVASFREQIYRYHQGQGEVSPLLAHPISTALRTFFRSFPLCYREEHTHLTGALQASFLHPLLMGRLESPEAEQCRQQLRAVYGSEADDLTSVSAVESMLTLRDRERFDRYLQVLYLPKLVLIDRDSHRAAAYHMARTLYERYNVGFLRLKFTYSRLTTDPREQIPGAQLLTGEDCLLGLYEGFRRFQTEQGRFSFALSPCFRKEPGFYDPSFITKQAHFQAQVDEILAILERHPELAPHLTEVDTVGDERLLYRKEHFMEMQQGLRKLAARGFAIRSHHGETFYSLKRGIQAVDNAMNIWRIDTLEHGLSLGINPNHYYQLIMEEALAANEAAQAIKPEGIIGRELQDMRWDHHDAILHALLRGERLGRAAVSQVVKVKFHHAREVEHYQHDVLNRLIDKSVSVTALPTSNQKLTTVVPGFKDHPFSWWEKKGVELGIGTDNYVTLGTDYIKEMLLLLFAEPEDLKITKLLMVATGEKRRPYLSHLLWQMRKRYPLSMG